MLQPIDLLDDGYEVEVPRAEYAPGLYSYWIGIEDPGRHAMRPVKVPFGQKGGSNRRLPQYYRFLEICRLKKLQQKWLEASLGTAENFNYGEGIHYREPRIPRGLPYKSDFHARLWGMQVGLADMGFPRGHRHYGKRRCVAKTRTTRCRDVALDDERFCQFHMDTRLWKRTPKFYKDVLANMSMKYSTRLAERAKDLLGMNDLSLREELAISRALLDESLKLIDETMGIEGREQMTAKEVRFLTGQNEAVARIYKQVVDAESKMALTASELEKLNRRIVEGVMKFVEEKYQEQLIDYIHGKGTEQSAGLLETGIQETEGEEIEAAEV